MPVLDTNILIALLKKEEAALVKIKALEEGGQEISTTALNACEIYRGAYASQKLREKKAALESFIGRMEVLPFDEKAAKTAAKIIHELSADGKSISDLDALIAAIAITNNDTLVTRDKDFKRIKELRVETW